jgi:hypothetical protein
MGRQFVVPRLTAASPTMRAVDVEPSANRALTRPARHRRRRTFCKARDIIEAPTITGTGSCGRLAARPRVGGGVPEIHGEQATEPIIEERGLRLGSATSFVSVSNTGSGHLSARLPIALMRRRFPPIALSRSKTPPRLWLERFKGRSRNALVARSENLRLKQIRAYSQFMTGSRCCSFYLSPTNQKTVSCLHSKKLLWQRGYCIWLRMAAYRCIRHNLAHCLIRCL